jgi:hypothetical protein
MSSSPVPERGTPGRPGRDPTPPPDRDREPTYVQVPLDLPPMPATDLVHWIILCRYAGQNPWCWPSQPRLQNDLGRDGDDTSNLTRVQARLVAAGLLEKRRRYLRGKTSLYYRPLRRARRGDGRAYIELPTTLLEAMRAGDVTPGDVAAAVWWLGQCQDRGGWTDASIADAAEAAGHSGRTARRHRSTLLRLGVLEERQIAGKAALTGVPGRLPTRDNRSASPVTAGPEDPGLASKEPPASQSSPKDPTSTTLSEEPQKNHQVSVPAGTDLAVVDACDRDGAAAPRTEDPSPHGNPRCGPPDRTVAGRRVLARLPRAWRDCPGWVRRRMADRLDRAVAAGYGPDAIAAAVARYAPTPDDADAHSCDGGHFPGRQVRHTRALDKVLRLLAADVNAGHCRTCGHHHADDTAHLAASAGVSPVWPAGDGRCIACDAVDAPIREDLPLRSPVCDGCWTASHQLERELADAA